MWAAAMENVQCLISHKDQTILTVDEAYNLFYTEARMEVEWKLHAISEVIAPV
jgi:hypothetical protein